MTLSREQFIEHYWKLRASGAKNAEIAKGLGIKEASLARRLLRYGVKPESDVVPRPLPEHGTYGRYDTHKCRCETCRLANNIRQKAANKRRSAMRRQGIAEFEHGYCGYTNWGCRCHKCSDEHSERMRVNRLRRMMRAAS